MITQIDFEHTFFLKSQSPIEKVTFVHKIQAITIITKLATIMLVFKYASRNTFLLELKLMFENSVSVIFAQKNKTQNKGILNFTPFRVISDFEIQLSLKTLICFLKKFNKKKQIKNKNSIETHL